MTRLSPWVVLLLLAQAGCTVTAVSPEHDQRRNNSCSSDADCDNNHCSEGLCQTLNGAIETLFVSVTPPSDSPIPHLTFVATVENVPTSGGPLDLELPGPSTIKGSLVLPSKAPCYPTFTDAEHPHVQSADLSLPAQVTFELRQRLLGLPQQIYFAKTPNDPLKGHYGFDLQVPAGEYDVYLVPPPGQSACPIPPQLVRGQVIDEGALDISFAVAPISTLTLIVHWLKSSASLTGWVADIIEPIGGRPISTQVVLGDPFDPGPLSTTVDYKVELAYSAVAEPKPSDSSVTSAHELFRLRPAANVVAPTIYLDRTGLQLFPGAVDYSEFTHFPGAVEVQGQMARLDTGAPVGGDVTLVSTLIAGVDDGIFASFQTTVQVGDDGLFTLEMPPGNYLVQAIPPLADAPPPVAGALAVLETTWDIPADVAVQAGKLLEIPPLAQLIGQALVQGAQVEAMPAPQTVLPFDQAFGKDPFSPRATSALVDETGHFTVQADPGHFHLTVQAPEVLGFGWFVRQDLQIGRANQDLGRLGLPKPSVLTGTARVGFAGTNAPLSSSSIRAYAYLDKALAYTRDPRRAESVVQVAETRSDDNGAFRLLIPESIGSK